jgi:sodium/potassium-transporting ATPase subunit alpha
VKIHHLSIEEAYSSIQSAPSGLSLDEARRRLSEYGRNEVEEVSRRPLPLTSVGEFIHFFAIILWIAAGLAFFSEWRYSRDACPTR